MGARRAVICAALCLAIGLGTVTASAAQAVLGLGTASVGVGAATFPAAPQLACTVQISAVADPEFSNAVTLNGSAECNLPATFDSQSIRLFDSLAPSRSVTTDGQGAIRGFYTAMVATPNFGPNGDRLARYCALIRFGDQSAPAKAVCATTALPF